MPRRLRSRFPSLWMRKTRLWPATLSLALVGPLAILSLSDASWAAGVASEADPSSGSGVQSKPAQTTEADWPQFRGPRRDGVSRQEGLMSTWQGEGPRELWRRPLGEGFSGVAAVGDLLVTMESGDGVDAVVALDAEDGRTRWRTPLGDSFENPFGNGPRTTPTVAGDRVVAVGSTMRLVVLALADGSVLWQNELRETYGTPVPRFGYSSSPLVVDDLVVVDVGGVDAENPEPALVAFDLADGSVRWTALEGRTDYSSPLLVELAGVRQILMNRGVGPEVVSLSTEGEVLWRHPGPPSVIALPVVLPPGDLFLSSDSDDYGGHRIRVTSTADPDGFEVTEIWQNRRMRNHMATSVLVDDHLFGFDNATLQALDAATGERRWAVRGFGKGTLVAGGDLLYVVGDDGTLALIRASGESYEELGRLQATTGKSWTAPTLGHGRLLLRDQDEIVAYDVRQGNDTPLASSARDTLATLRSPATGPAALSSQLETILARYAKARGGVERWRRTQALRFSGTYATFSNIAPFEATYRRVEAPGDATYHPGAHFRIDLEMLGFPTTRGLDAEGPWMVYPLLGLQQPTRLTDTVGEGGGSAESTDPGDEGEAAAEGGGNEFAPYATMITREAFFEPPLLDPAGHGITVELLEPGDVAGRPTLALALTFPDGQQETWHLDPDTHLEVAIESTVHDLTLNSDPLVCRTFFSDWIEVDGLHLPRHLEREFSSRLEVITLEDVDLDPTIEPGFLTMPEVAPDSEE